MTIKTTIKTIRKPPKKSEGRLQTTENVIEFQKIYKYSTDNRNELSNRMI